MNQALEVSGLKKSFGGVAAVRGVDFAVAAGEAVALIGPNGAGKTTTFNLINGQLRPDAGRVNLHGADITGKAPEQLFRLGVARTFQITATFASMTVRENLQMALLSHERRAHSAVALATRESLVNASRLLTKSNNTPAASLSLPSRACASASIKYISATRMYGMSPMVLVEGVPGNRNF